MIHKFEIFKSEACFAGWFFEHVVAKTILWPKRQQFCRWRLQELDIVRSQFGTREVDCVVVITCDLIVNVALPI